ncbi:MAG: glycosyltransferase [Segetibacter sp.]
MNETPLISICIPAYKNLEYLKRLLESISVQTFKDFEVVITDDTNNSSVSDYIHDKRWDFQISYYKNETVLGSPQNWNAAVNHSKGEWIKIMHYDDWFSSHFAGNICTGDKEPQKF